MKQARAFVSTPVTFCPLSGKPRTDVIKEPPSSVCSSLTPPSGSKAVGKPAEGLENF